MTETPNEGEGVSTGECHNDHDNHCGYQGRGLIGKYGNGCRKTQPTGTNNVLDQIEYLVENGCRSVVINSNNILMIFIIYYSC